jgi:carbonic anhydrase
MKALFVVVMAVLTFSSLASAQAWNHDPASPIGPLHWGKVEPLDATCGDSVTGEVGMKRSPIDIVPANALMASFSAPLFKYQPTPLKIENTGHYAPGERANGNWLDPCWVKFALCLSAGASGRYLHPGPVKAFRK